MAFQQPPLQQFQASGVQGDRYSDAPWASQAWILVSDSAAKNIIGAVGMTFDSTNNGARAGGSGPFLGFLANSKEQANVGSGGNAFASNMTLPNYVVADIVNMGEIYMKLASGTAVIGDLIVMDTTSGLLTTISPATPVPGGKTYTGAIVMRFCETVAGTLVVAQIRAITTPAEAPDVLKAKAKKGADSSDPQAPNVNSQGDTK